MNYFTTKRLTTWSIIILVILNLFTLGALWFQQFRPPPRPPQGNGQDVQGFLKEELGLTEEQTQQFKKLREQHFTQSKVLVESMDQLKRELISEVFTDSPDTAKVEQLVEGIGAKQTELEQLRFNHFLELKSLCEPGQVKKFQELFHEIFPPAKPPESGRPPEPDRPPDSPRQSPPQEARDACQGKNTGDSCQFSAPRGTVTGTCRQRDNQLVCAPERR